jgi:hypothetical protein
MFSLNRFLACTGIAALAFTAFHSASAQEKESHRGSERVQAAGASIPPSLKAEHQELHEALGRLVKAGGRTGQAAMEVEKRLAPHFVKEEEIAMPQLGLLQSLARGERPADTASIIRISEKLEAELPQMLSEHKQIVAALDKLRAAGQAEKKPAAVHFADDLILHAQTEEQVLYPAAILVGKYLKMQRE